MKSSFLAAVFLLSGFTGLSAQSITPEVIASSGDNFANASGQINYTLGELMIETRISSGNILTEGFHQPDILITGVTDYSPVITAEIFPNPASSSFSVSVNGNGTDYRIDLFDSRGALISQSAVQQNSTTVMDVSSIPPGMYFVQISQPDGKLLKTCKLIRSN